MLRKQPWFDFCDALAIEVEQRADEGCDTARFAERAKEIQEMPRGAARTAAGVTLLAELQVLPASRKAQEPSDLAGIQALAEGENAVKTAPDFDRIYGAWLGRCAGCLLGQPVEGWRRARINGLLE